MTDRMKKIFQGVDAWCGFYRENPHRFAKDYLHLNLHLFQKILLVMMNWSSTTVFIGSRGIGKTFLSAVFCVIRCILYPGQILGPTFTVMCSKNNPLNCWNGYIVLRYIVST